jgi:hypothetical protein
MNKRIIYPNDDGGVSIIIPAPDAREKRLISPAVIKTQEVDGETVPYVLEDAVYEDETDEEFIARIAGKDVPAGKPYKIIDAEDVPTDRTFRNAWEYQE